MSKPIKLWSIQEIVMETHHYVVFLYKLDYAVINDGKEMVERLLKEGVDPNIKN